VNRTAERRIGIGVSYIPTRVRHIGATRLSATLVRGTDTYRHFDHEPAPLADEDDAALRAHADSVGRFWKASESIPAMALMH
jgi:non-heme Fe2+,alpha-ketoglutarate-dependent halogenase